MKTRSIERVRKAPAQSTRRWLWSNMMSFPQALREAIPTLERCWGRCLILSSITGRSLNSRLLGKRVQIKFQVEESGKLTGKFDVWMDLDPEAARALAHTLTRLAGEAEKAPPVAV
jgi:hypothetical protein